MLARALPDTVYFDCELPSVRRKLRDPEAFLAEHTGRRLVLDEIHRLDDPAELLKIAADHHPDIRILATGSSSLSARAKFRDTLAGRKHEVWLTPMTHADVEVDFVIAARRASPMAIECKWSQDAFEPEAMLAFGGSTRRGTTYSWRPMCSGQARDASKDWRFAWWDCDTSRSVCHDTRRSLVERIAPKTPAQARRA